MEINAHTRRFIETTRDAFKVVTPGPGTGDMDIDGGVRVKQQASAAGAEMKMLHKQVEHTVAGGGLTETLTAAIPANAYVLGIHSKIKTIVVMATGVTFLVGVTGDTNRYGNHAALTVNDVVTPAEMQAEGVGVGRYYNAAANVLLTANAGTFTSGVVVVDIYYFDLSPSDNF